MNIRLESSNSCRKLRASNDTGSAIVKLNGSQLCPSTWKRNVQDIELDGSV
jgi:hypothetical protein